MGGILKLTRAAALACLSLAPFCSRAIAQDYAKPLEENSLEQRRIKWGVENDFSSGHVWRGLEASQFPWKVHRVSLSPIAYLTKRGQTRLGKRACRLRKNGRLRPLRMATFTSAAECRSRTPSFRKMFDR